MILRLNWRKTIVEDIVIVDSRFPRPTPYGFRNTEINALFKKLPGFKSYTMHSMKPGDLAWFTHNYGVKKKEFEINKKGYLKYYPENENKVRYLDPDKKYKFNLAYSYFLADTYTLLPFYEKNNIDFVFVLYPGGGFGLNNKSSDQMLKAIFASQNFKKVIVTKNVTNNYLLSKNLCAKSRISSMHGYVQFYEKDILKKIKYQESKSTFDLCFTAAKYSEKGVDKGFDIFIETAKVLCRKYDDFRFHVIGGFDENEIEVSEIKDKITFYGYKTPKFLKKFYAKMDIFLSPNRAFKLFKGNFDGLLGADAAYMGVALFATDELNQHTHFNDGQDFVEINTDVNDIVKKIEFYYRNPQELYRLSEAGQKVMIKTFSIDKEVDKRIKLFNKILNSSKR
jgi:glycosyltransferase involved in cell wall biosynthesis